MNEPNKELAGRLCCAFGSYVAGVGYEHCRSTYFDEERMNPYWLALAETVLRANLVGSGGKHPSDGDLDA